MEIPKEVAKVGLERALAEVVAPLVESDDGELYLVGVEKQLIRLHLGGRFAGCPGNELVREQLLRPLVLSICPKATLQVTSGALLPPGAKRISAMISL